MVRDRNEAVIVTVSDPNDPCSEGPAEPVIITNCTNRGEAGHATVRTT